MFSIIITVFLLTGGGHYAVASNRHAVTASEQVGFLSASCVSELFVLDEKYWEGEMHTAGLQQCYSNVCVWLWVKQQIYFNHITVKLRQNQLILGKVKNSCDL